MGLILQSFLVHFVDRFFSFNFLFFVLFFSFNCCFFLAKPLYCIISEKCIQMSSVDCWCVSSSEFIAEHRRSEVKENNAVLGRNKQKQFYTVMAIVIKNPVPYISKYSKHLRMNYSNWYFCVIMYPFKFLKAFLGV